MVRALALVFLVLVSSCSVALMETEDPAIDIVHHDPRCTGTKGYGAWDLVNAAVSVASTIAAAKSDSLSGAEYVVPVAGAVAYLASGIYGLTAADKCKELRRRRDIVNGNIADRIQMLTKAEIDRQRTAKKEKSAAPVPDAGIPAVDVDAGIPDAGAVQ